MMGACVDEFERVDTSPLIIQLLVHLGISTLAATSDITFRVALYVLFKLAIVPDLCTVVDTQELDKSVLIRGNVDCGRSHNSITAAMGPNVYPESGANLWWQPRQR
jgi:hypothetical protein